MGVGTIMVRSTNNQLQDLPRGSTTTVCRVSSRNFTLETSPAPPPTPLDEILVCPFFFYNNTLLIFTKVTCYIFVR